MLDFEDSMKPAIENVLSGLKNVIGAVAGNLTQKKYVLNPNDMDLVSTIITGGSSSTLAYAGSTENQQFVQH